MANTLKMDKQEAICGLLALGWSHRRIADKLRIHRRTVKRYADSKCTIAQTGSEGTEGAKCTISQTGKPGRQSLCEEHGELIREKYVAGLSVERIHQDLRIGHGFKGSYHSVQRRLLKGHADEATAVAFVLGDPPIPKSRGIRGHLGGFEDCLPAHQAEGYGAVGTVNAQVKGGGFGWSCRLHRVILSFVFWTRGGDGNRAGFVSAKASSEESFRPCWKTDRGRVSCRSSKDITFHDSRSVVQNTSSPFPGNPSIFLSLAVPRMLALFAPCG
ncbi:MAG: hypothetical protein GVY36_06605 [Verrucomicrobia bacterium]|nr:hypothetical protein [Verrucomicrobiota bacterium]